MRLPVRAFLIPAVLLAVLPLTAQKSSDCAGRRSISVTGSATISVDADLAIVHVGYKFYAPDANTAYANATQASNAIVTALTGLGIPKTDIESSEQSLQHTPLFELQQDPANRAQREFTITQSWTVDVAPEQAGKTLNAAIRAGANDSGTIEWRVRDTAPLEAEAAAKAIQNAHAIAQKMAASSGVRLGNLLTASEGQSTPIFPRPMMMAMAKTAEQPAMAINARKVQVSMTVSAVYEIE
ncbi:MAG: SIMPL domain-containing protein [Acidobacteriota bacterium]